MILCLCTFRGYFRGKVEDFIQSRSIFNCSRKSNYLSKDAKGGGREEAAAGITFNTKYFLRVSSKILGEIEIFNEKGTFSPIGYRGKRSYHCRECK